LQLEADLHLGEETSQIFVATKSSTPNTSTRSIVAERLGSPGDKESGASRTANNPGSLDDDTTRRGTKPPEQVRKLIRFLGTLVDIPSKALAGEASIGANDDETKEG